MSTTSGTLPIGRSFVLKAWIALVALVLAATLATALVIVRNATPSQTTTKAVKTTATVTHSRGYLRPGVNRLPAAPQAISPTQYAGDCHQCW